MDVFEAICTRRSIRRWKPDPIPEEDLRTIIDMATKAPSASNRQNWRFLIVSNRRVLEEMKDAILRKMDSIMEWPEAQPYQDRLLAGKGYSTFFPSAPATIVVLSEPYEGALEHVLQAKGWGQAEIDELRQKPGIQNIGAAVQNLSLAAHAMGYGTCWMTAPCVAGPEMKDLLGIQSPWEIAALLPIGIPDYEPPLRPRKPLEEVLEFIR